MSLPSSESDIVDGGDASMSPEQIQDASMDELLSAFTSPTFEKASYLSQVVHNRLEQGNNDLAFTTFESDIRRLNRGVKHVDSQLKDQVESHHEELVDQVATLPDLESRLVSASQLVSSLSTTVNRLRMSIAEPHAVLKERMSQLTNVWKTSELLRATARFLDLSKKLTFNPPSRATDNDLPKHAKTIHELQTLLIESDLSGIEVVESEMRLIKEESDKLQKRAEKILLNGIDTLNQGDVGTSLLVFLNLKTLPEMVHLAITNLTATAVDTLKQTLDSDPSRAGGSTSVFSRLEKGFSNLLSLLDKCSLLERVLAKKRDPVSHQVLLTYLHRSSASPSQPLLTLSFWNSMAQKLSEILAISIQRTGTPLYNALVDDFPRLLSSLRSFAKNVNTIISQTSSALLLSEGSSSAAASQQTLAFLSIDAWPRSMSSVASLEAEYLAKVLKRLQDRVVATATRLASAISPTTLQQLQQQQGNNNLNIHQLIASASTASLSDTRALCQAAKSECEAAKQSGDSKLVSGVCKVVSKSVKMFAVRCETLVITDKDAVVLNQEESSPSQHHNASLYNCLLSLAQGIGPSPGGVMAALPSISECQDALNESINSVESLMESIITPLIDAICNAGERQIARMHRHDYGSSSASSGPNPSSASSAQTMGSMSPYLQALEKRINTLRSAVLSLYSKAGSISPFTGLSQSQAQSANQFLYNAFWPAPFEAKSRQTAAKLLRSFVRNASLVRPLSENGKLRLAADVAQLQLIVGQIYSLDSLQEYKEVRALRTLLFAETKDILGLPEIRDGVLSKSIAAMHLFSRLPATSVPAPSRPDGAAPLPPSFVYKSPYQAAELTVDQFLSWVNTHTEKQLWNDMLSVAVTACEAEAKKSRAAYHQAATGLGLKARAEMTAELDSIDEILRTVGDLISAEL